MKENISVLILTTSFPTKHSAAGIFVWDECVALSEKGVEVTVVAPHCAGAPKEEVIKGVRIVRFRYFFPTKFQGVAYGNGIPVNLKNSLLAKLQLPFFAFAFLITALRESKNKKIIHCHWFIAGLIGVVVYEFRGAKLILMMHHAHTPNRIFRYILKNTDFLFCNSSYVEKATLKIFPIKEHRLIPVTVNTKQFLPKNAQSKAEHSVQIFTAGRFIPLKGFLFLINAIHILANEKQMQTIHLKIAGDGILRTDMVEQVKNLGLKDYVSFLGQVNHSKLSAYFNAADIFVIPSIVDDNGDTEGLGLVTLEAAACGLPLIGTKVGGIPDVIEHGVNGFLVEQKNARQLAERIQQLAEDGKLREKFGSAARQLLKNKFNRKTITQKITQVYEKLASK